MTVSRQEKAAAHELAQITGGSYQASLSALRLLRPARGEIDMGGLGRLLGGDDHLVTLAVPADSEVVSNLRRLVSIFGVSRRPSIVAPGVFEESSLFVPFEHMGWELLIEFGLLDGVRPLRYWMLSTERLVSAAGEPEPDFTLMVPARAAADVTLLPENEPDGWLSPDAATVRPEWTQPGPGFDWCGISFESIGQVRGPEEDHDYDHCESPYACGFSHEWPSADPSREGIVLPNPVFDAYQRLAQWDGHSVEESRERVPVSNADGSEWWGVDLPNFNTIWMLVPDHPADLAAPSY